MNFFNYSSSCRTLKQARKILNQLFYDKKEKEKVSLREILPFIANSKLMNFGQRKEKKKTIIIMVLISSRFQYLSIAACFER